jgi:hypothetical protein
MRKIIADWKEDQDNKAEESLDRLERVNQQYQQREMIQQNQHIECQLIHLNNSQSAIQQSIPYYSR